ncbi:hypothetical protein GCM10007940_44350 [Portibacter lacus]|uniref:beta-N-acetylhexosaminidase n=2 Tax=Portibacter lacus TaxID=1099794 RepID=A0AA37SU88_9BACT|nr:hypothetical protein GCM10007940_44350 [Portibacter lacus]
MPIAAHLQDLHLIPSPQSVEINEEIFDVSKRLTTYSLLKVENEHPVKEQIDLLLKEFKAKGSNQGGNFLWYGTVGDDVLLSKYCQKNKITIPAHREGYALHVSNDTIIVAAGKKEGVLYGLYTLEQLVNNTNNNKLPSVSIIDYPNYDNRSIMDDISRGPLSNMDFLKSQVKRMSKLKINNLTFYIEHVVKTKSHPDFAPDDAITIAEFEELTEFAKPFNVEVMGGFQSLGHFRNILSSETYRHLGQTDRMLKPGDPASLDFLTKVYGEMLPAFSSEYFNIYADEAWDLVRMDEGLEVDSSAAALRYINHVNPLLKFLTDRGKKPIIASDMLLSFPETIDLLSKKATILSWVYDDLDNYDAWIEPFREVGLEYWVCPGILNSYSVFPDYDVAFNNIEKFVNAGHEKDALGVMTSVWDDGSAHFFARDWPAVAFAAHQSWKPVRNDQANFNRDFSFLMFGDENKSLRDCISGISELQHTKTVENLGTTFLDEYLLPDAGQVHYLNTNESETISKIIKEGKSCLDEVADVDDGAANEWTDDLEAWHFALDQILLQVKSYEKLIALSSLYSKGDLDAVSSELETLATEWKGLKERFSALWKIENRDYWLDEELKIYNRKIERLLKLKDKIDALDQKKTKLPTAGSVGIDIRPLDKEYFTYWLISERFPTQNESDIDKDYIGSLGGEKEAIPTPYDWTKYQSPYSYKINFDEVSEKSIVYLYSRIEAPEQIKVVPEVGFSGQWKMILNGEETTNSKEKDNRIVLEEGNNHIIMKIALAPGIDQIQFSLKDINTTNKKYKYKLKSE